MNLLYVWNEFYNKVNAERGYLLNSKYDIEYYKSERRLCIKQNDDYVEGFWGEHIFDVMAVVGENGAGKTELAGHIMYTLEILNVLNGYSQGIIAAFEDKTEEKTDIKIFVSDKYRHISVDGTVNYRLIPSSECIEIEKFKFGYFTNVFSLNDYKYKKSDPVGIIFDASLGGNIRENYDYKLRMNYINADKDKISSFYEDEILQMLEFMNSDLSKIKIPFVLPKNVLLYVSDYHVNLKNILAEFDKAGKKGEESVVFNSENKKILEESCQYVLRKYKDCWYSQLIINLILNLFKEICIPQASDNTSESETIEFLKELSMINEMNSDDVFTMMLKLLYNIVNSRNEREVNVYIRFVNWLSDNIFKEDNWNVNRERCYFDLREDNSIVKELLIHYNNTNHVYPYLEFNFGLSSGEFNLLKLFSKIAALQQKDSDGEFYVVNSKRKDVKCENLVLFFDEVDLSLHPRWQQKYLDWLLQFVSTYFVNCTVQIIVATHSPIMLSDFPRNNVLYLWKDKEKSYAQKRDIKTFGNNIHTLFLDSFFLDKAGTMGAFAEKKINEIAYFLNNNIDVENEDVLKIINNIGDDLIRNKLLQIYNSKIYIEEEIEPEKPDETIIDRTINLVKKQIESLESTLSELERIKGDKN